MLKNKIDDLRKCEDFDSIGKLHNRKDFHKVQCARYTSVKGIWCHKGLVGSQRSRERVNTIQLFFKGGSGVVGEGSFLQNPLLGVFNHKDKIRSIRKSFLNLSFKMAYLLHNGNSPQPLSSQGYMGSGYQTHVFMLAPRRLLPTRQPGNAITEGCRAFSPSEWGRCLPSLTHCDIRWDRVKPGGFEQHFSGSSMTRHSTLQAAILFTVCHAGNQPSE